MKIWRCCIYCRISRREQCFYVVKFLSELEDSKLVTLGWLYNVSMQWQPTLVCTVYRTQHLLNVDPLFISAKWNWNWRLKIANLVGWWLNLDWSSRDLRLLLDVASVKCDHWPWDQDSGILSSAETSSMVSTVTVGQFGSGSVRGRQEYEGGGFLGRNGRRGGSDEMRPILSLSYPGIITTISRKIPSTIFTLIKIEIKFVFFSKKKSLK